ncbi:MAG: hypothetical protein IPM54_30090 [Polyangiaceae bacterium]|nr:hypothetical protein [Polyangiaceae bacterium]
MDRSMLSRSRLLHKFVYAKLSKPTLYGKNPAQPLAHPAPANPFRNENFAPKPVAKAFRKLQNVSKNAFRALRNVRFAFAAVASPTNSVRTGHATVAGAPASENVGYAGAADASVGG